MDTAEAMLRTLFLVCLALFVLWPALWVAEWRAAARRERARETGADLSRCIRRAAAKSTLEGGTRITIHLASPSPGGEGRGEGEVVLSDGRVITPPAYCFDYLKDW